MITQLFCRFVSEFIFMLILCWLCFGFPLSSQAEIFKEQGNAYYSKKDYPAAFNYYTKAIGKITAKRTGLSFHMLWVIMFAHLHYPSFPPAVLSSDGFCSVSTNTVTLFLLRRNA